jgi:hypothetical protein
VADRNEIVRALIERVTVTMAGNTENVAVRIQWIGGTSTEHAHIEVLQLKVRDEGFESGAAGLLSRYAQGQSSSHL